MQPCPFLYWPTPAAFAPQQHPNSREGGMGGPNRKCHLVPSRQSAEPRWRWLSSWIAKGSKQGLPRRSNSQDSRSPLQVTTNCFRNLRVEDRVATLLGSDRAPCPHKIRLGLVFHGWMIGQMTFPLPLLAYTNLSHQTSAESGERDHRNAYLSP